MNFFSTKYVIFFSFLITAVKAEKIDFATQIQPILSENCYACHGPDEAKVEGGLHLHTREKAIRGGDTGKTIVPGDPDASELFKRIIHSDPTEFMPPPDKKKPLSSEQIALLRQWIAEGAEWGTHWAFQTPQRPPVPTVKQSAWVKNPIDSFVLAKLEAANLQPSPQADSTTLLRRLSLDLVGLPPSLDELATKDEPAAAIERLISTPHFGERWAREWLDAARYSDSAGYEKDLARMNHFYRDWVVAAMNKDMPYNQFVIKQIAGDLLPNATQEDRIATGFLRNSMTNEEGGAKPEQFRVEGIFDRVDAIGKSILGLTTQCAQCHTHKYDPLTHQEYYGIFAYLNQIEEASIPALNPDDSQRSQEILQKVAAIDTKIRQSSPEVEKSYLAWQQSLLALPRTDWHALELYQLGDSGQAYWPQPDRSIINMGYAATRGAETFTSSLNIPSIQSARLEVMNDPYLPMNGPGRSTRGTGALTEFVLRAGSQADKLEKLPFINPVASVNPPEKPLDPMRFPSDEKRQPDNRRTGPAAMALDNDQKTAWTNERDALRNNEPAVLTFSLEKPFAVDGTMHFKYNLVQNHGGHNSDENQTYNLGRIRLSVAATLPNALDQLPPLVLDALLASPEKRSAEQEQRLFAHWREQQSAFTAETQEIEALFAQAPQTTWTLVAAQTRKPRTTRLFERGEQTQPKHEVQPHVPAFLHPLPVNEEPTSRLTFAKWLVDPASPVAARVYVNRIWQAYFGIGLLETSEDFGHQAARPSHRELLDWLACEFMENGWSSKHIHRLITNSATYQQSSNITPASYDLDPKNRSLARGPRFRVPAETVRDIQLAASGLINPQLGGRSVFPPAPAYLFQRPVSYGPKTWDVEKDTQRYRRALYTFRFRSVPYPMLATFDAPSGSVSCVKRTRSTTPLQALVTLNEQISLEAALALAHSILNDQGTMEEKISRAFQRCTARIPSADELSTLVKLHQQALDDPASSEVSLLRENYQPPTLDLQQHPLPQLHAAATIARVILNLDETITKN